MTKLVASRPEATQVLIKQGEPASDEGAAQTLYEAAAHLIGRHGSERDDLSTNHSRLLKEKLRVKHSR